ncbi:hypothetical protein SALBM135S_08710 [Streptomyces alboniger]
MRWSELIEAVRRSGQYATAAEAERVTGVVRPPSAARSPERNASTWRACSPPRRHG